MQRTQRPYFSLIAFLALLSFVLYIAISSWNYHPPPGQNPLMAGRVIYLAIIARGVCADPPCPPIPAAPPYPVMQDFTANGAMNIKKLAPLWSPSLLEDKLAPSSAGKGRQGKECPMNSCLSLPWGRLAYSDSGGQATPLIFLHGTGCDSADWRGVLAALPPGSRQICLDFRGHGASSVPAAPFTLGNLAEDVLALAGHLRLARCLLVGHSLGGMVALQAARQVAARSAQVAGLILLEGWTSLSAAQAFEGERFYGRLDPFAIARIRAKWERTVDSFPPAVWQVFWHTVETFDAWDTLQSARIPIWEVYGGLGRAEQTQTRLQVPANPCICWRWLAGAGHYLPHERPGEVAEICAAACAQAPQPLP